MSSSHSNESISYLFTISFINEPLYSNVGTDESNEILSVELYNKINE